MSGDTGPLGGWYTVNEAADFLSVHPSAVSRYIYKGVLPSKMRGGRHWIFVDDLRELKRQRSRGAPTDPRPIILGGKDKDK